MLVGIESKNSKKPAPGVHTPLGTAFSAKNPIIE